MNALYLLLTLGVATVLGAIATKWHIPGGMILGALIGASVVTLSTDREIIVPSWVQDSSLIVIGAAIGVQMTRESISRLLPILAPALLAGVLIICSGVGIAYLLRFLGLDPPGDVLATSPGAVSVMAAIAVEEETGVVEVALFHLVRVVLVIVSLPLIFRLIHRG